jgi:hypothetical protein
MMVSRSSPAILYSICEYTADDTALRHHHVLHNTQALASLLLNISWPDHQLFLLTALTLMSPSSSPIISSASVVKACVVHARNTSAQTEVAVNLQSSI